jgi:hypothetical protein
MACEALVLDAVDPIVVVAHQASRCVLHITLLAVGHSRAVADRAKRLLREQ